MILILTGAGDALMPFALGSLDRKGAPYARFNTSQFPGTVSVSLRYGAGTHSSGSLVLEGQEIDLASVRTVWYRRPGPPLPDPAFSSEDQKFVLRESQHVLSGLWHCLRDRFWVNPYDASRAAEHKLYQLRIARAIGFDAPRTIVTNDPAEATAFFDACRGDIVYKTLSGYARQVDSKPHGIFTTRVNRDDLVAHRERIQAAPCIFQEYVPKQSELRVTVIGDRVFTSEIDSQQGEFSKDDWRRNSLMEHPPQRPFQLPDAVEALVQSMLQRMGLVFGCFDFVRTPDGRFVFLELNPNGQWLWVEQATGMPLLDSFTEMLRQGTPHYTAAQAHSPV